MKIIHRIMLSIAYCILINCTPYIQTTIIGNKTAVFIIPNAPIFPVGDTNNIMLGFGSFQGGFTLENNSTQCIFDSVFPVSGTVNMNGGTLYLQQDLILTETINLQGLGTIIGNNHTIEFASSISSLPSNFTLIKDVNLYFKSDVTLNSSLNIQGKCLISSTDNRTISLANGQLSLAAESELTLQNITLKDVTESNLRAYNETVHIIADNATCILAGNLTLDHGTITIRNKSSLVGPYTLTCSTSANCIIDTNSTLVLDGNLELLFGRYSPSSQEPITFIDASSTLQCGFCTLHITNSGAQFTNGTIAFMGNANLITDSKTDPYGFTFGNNTAGHDMTVYLGPGSLTTYISGIFTYNNFNADGYTSSSENSTIYIKGDTTFYLATDYTYPRNTIVEDSRARPILAPGVSTYFNNCSIYISAYGTVRLDTYADYPNSFYAILKSGNSIVLDNGTLVLYTLVTDQNTKITGVGAIASPIIFQPNTALSVGIQGSINNYIQLNNSRLTLANDLTYNYTDFASSGTIDLGSYTLTRKYKSGSIFSSSMTFTGTLGTLNLTQDATLQASWNFYGNITVEGNGNSLDLGNGNITVHPGAIVTFKNIKLSNVSEQSLTAAYGASVTFDNISVILTGDLNADSGTFAIKNNVYLTGPYTLSYKSNEPCTIEQNAALILDNGITFSCGKTSITSNEPILFTDATSVLACRLCTLHITGSGMQLTKGTLSFEGTSRVIVDSTDPTCGLIFGNSPVASDDLAVNFSAGCNTYLLGGVINYNNVSPDKYLNSATSSVLTLYPDLILYMSTSCNLPGNTFIEIYSGTFVTMLFAPGTRLNLNNTQLNIPGYGNATYTGHFESPTGSAAVKLDSNDYIYLTSGTPGNVIVDGSGTSIIGTGFIQTPLILTSTNASTQISLQGPFAGDLDLNGGTLTLLSDLSLLSPNLSSNGLIDLGTNTLYRKMPANQTVFAQSVEFLGDLATISLEGDYVLSCTWTFHGNVTIDGNGNTLSFDGGSIVIADESNLAFKNIKLTNITDPSIKCLNNSGSIIFDNTTLVLAGDCQYTTGAFSIKNLVTISGPYTFLYDSSISSTVEANSTLLLADGVKFDFGKVAPNSAQPLILAAYSSTLDCNQCTLHTTGYGATLSRGILKFDGSVVLEGDSTDTARGLVFGDHTTAENDLQVIFGAGCIARVQSGALTYNNINSDGFSNSAPSSTFTLYAGVTFHVSASCILPGIKFLLIGVPDLILDQNTYLYLAGTNFSVLGVGDAVYTGHFKWPYGVSLFYMENGDSIFLTNGSMLVPTIAEGTQTQIGGIGTIAYPLLLAPGATNVMSLQGTINSNVYLNGGTINLLADTTLTTENCFASTGIVNLNTKTCSLQPPATTTYTVPVYWTGTSGTVECTQDIILTTTWTFAGDVVLDANGNSINFNGGTIAIAPASSLTIKNARLNNIIQDSIMCTDTTGSLTLYNVTWAQADNVTFTRGSLNYKGNVLLTGQNLQLTYASTATCIINSSTTLSLDNLFTFSYAPSNNSKSLFTFSDYTSRLALNHSILYIAPGLNLTKGQLTFSQQPSIYALGSGMTLGNEDISGGLADMQLIFLDTSFTYIQDGSLNYQNTQGTSLQMWTGGGFYFSTTSTCKAYQTINAGQSGQIIFDYGSMLYTKQAPGCPNISDVVGDKIFGKPDYPVDICSL